MRSTFVVPGFSEPSPEDQKPTWRGSVPGSGGRPASHATGQECEVHEEPSSSQGAGTAAQPCTWPTPCSWLLAPRPTLLCHLFWSLFRLDLSALPAPCLLPPCPQVVVFGAVFCADCAWITDLWDSFLQAACLTRPADLDLAAPGLVKSEMHLGTVKYEFRRAAHHSYQGDI